MVKLRDDVFTNLCPESEPTTIPRKGATQMPKRPVSESALIRRVNRKLVPDLHQLKKSRGETMRQDLGEFYVLDLFRNTVCDLNVDPEQIGRELGVLTPCEGLAARQG